MIVEAPAAPDLPPVEVDVVRVGQILSNLVGNARKYAPDASPIVIGADRRRTSWLVLTVDDEGVGYPRGGTWSRHGTVPPRLECPGIAHPRDWASVRSSAAGSSRPMAGPCRRDGPAGRPDGHPGPLRAAAGGANRAPQADRARDRPHRRRRTGVRRARRAVGRSGRLRHGHRPDRDRRPCAGSTTSARISSSSMSHPPGPRWLAAPGAASESSAGSRSSWSPPAARRRRRSGLEARRGRLHHEAAVVPGTHRRAWRPPFVGPRRVPPGAPAATAPPRPGRRSRRPPSPAARSSRSPSRRPNSGSSRTWSSMPASWRRIDRSSGPCGVPDTTATSTCCG